MLPLISIVIPVYNVENYIDKCIDSVIKQTYMNIEIILVNDGSTDRSSIKCYEWAKKDKRIKVIEKTNGGLSSARNKGIEASRGEYIGFVDSDDWIESDMFEVMMNDIITNDADLAICGIIDYYKGKKPVVNPEYYGVLNSIEAIKIAFEGPFSAISAVNKLYRKELFEKIRFPEGKIFEDAFIAVDIFLQCKKIVLNSKQKYYYYHRENSITTLSFSKNSFDVIEAYSHNRSLIKLNCPVLNKIAMERYCWACFWVLDRMLLCNEEKTYSEELKRIVRLLRKNYKRILRCSFFSRSRKISMIILMISLKGYKWLSIINTKKNLSPNAD